MYNVNSENLNQHGKSIVGNKPEEASQEATGNCSRLAAEGE